MRRVLLALVAFTITLSIAAQAKKEAKKATWKQGGTFTLFAGQGGSRNWAPGSEKFSLTGAAYLNLWATRTKGKCTWESTADLGYALVNTTSLGLRKNDDKIDLFSKATHTMKNPKWSWGAVVNLRTQFSDGFDYSGTQKRRMSGFFAPAYATGALGFQWKPCSNFSWFMSPASPRIVAFTNNPYSFQYQGGVTPEGDVETPLADKYGVKASRQVDVQFGAYSSMAVKTVLCKNVDYKSRLDLHSNVLRDEPFNIDVFWTNSISMKVNNWVMVNYNFDLVYDHDVKMFSNFKNRPGTQMRSMLGVGVAAKF